MDLKATLWGVRGSVPAPGADTKIYGGNTSCVQIETKDKNIIFDGGTGIIELGDSMAAKGGNYEADIFFSHMHWDHIQGLPFFTPFYSPGNRFTLYGEDKGRLTFKQAIQGQMESPFFPITMGAMKSNLEFISIKPNMLLDIGKGTKIKTFKLDHPNGCLLYKVDKGNSSIVYCTDTETTKGVERKKLIEFIYGADVFIYDSYFTEEEYIRNNEKWGHSTWEEGTRLSKEANIGLLVLFHHKRSRRDEELFEIELSAQKRFKNTVAAKEGMIITVGGDRSEKVVIDYSY